MNPLGSFSFGKIIKTFLPGLIATTGPLLAIELLYQGPLPYGRPPVPSWNAFFSHTLLGEVVLKDSVRATALGAALLPLALILGFLLNTALWLWVNPVFRGWVDRGLPGQVIRAREALEDKARELLPASKTDEGRPGVSLQGFYLPVVDLGKLTFLQETYFAWYEFQANSAAASLLVGVLYTAAFSLTLGAAPGPGYVGIYLGVPLALLIGFVGFLVFAAKRNLARYQESFLWFLIGSVHFHDAKKAR